MNGHQPNTLGLWVWFQGSEGSKVSVDHFKLENGNHIGYNDAHGKNQFVWVTSNGWKISSTIENQEIVKYFFLQILGACFWQDIQLRFCSHICDMVLSFSFSFFVIYVDHAISQL